MDNSSLILILFFIFLFLMYFYSIKTLKKIKGGEDETNETNQTDVIIETDETDETDETNQTGVIIETDVNNETDETDETDETQNLLGKYKSRYKNDILKNIEKMLSEKKLSLSDINIIESGLNSKYLYKITKINRYQKKGIINNTINILQNLANFEIFISKKVDPYFDSSKIQKKLNDKLKIVKELDTYMTLIEPENIEREIYNLVQRMVFLNMNVSNNTYTSSLRLKEGIIKNDIELYFTGLPINKLLIFQVSKNGKKWTDFANYNTNNPNKPLLINNSIVSIGDLWSCEKNTGNCSGVISTKIGKPIDYKYRAIPKIKLQTQGKGNRKEGKRNGKGKGNSEGKGKGNSKGGGKGGGKNNFNNSKKGGRGKY